MLPSSPSQPSHKPCILYIEDDASSRSLVSRVLSMDYEVLTAQNGLEGLNLLQRRMPDLVLTDLNLPDLNGEVIAARVRAMTREDVPIVAITAQTDRTFRNRAMAAGCIGYITKPIDIMALPGLVKEFLGGREEEIADEDRTEGSRDFQSSVAEQLEKTLRQVQEDNAALRNLERAKTAFLTQVSHELRTPLTVLSGYIQMLNQSLGSEQTVTDMHRELSRLAVDGTKRLHHLMNEIVVMARLASNQLEASMAPLRFEDVANEAVVEYDKAFEERKLTFVREGDAWPEAMMADWILVRMALSSLLSNAIKATPDGGKITMTVQKEKHHLHIIIADTGVGIEPDQMPLLFKPFFTAIDVSKGKTSKTQFKGMGMGIGLTLVTRVVEVHRGQIWAESTGYDEEKLPGSKFHMLLPLPEIPPDPNAVVPSTSASPVAPATTSEMTSLTAAPTPSVPSSVPSTPPAPVAPAPVTATTPPAEPAPTVAPAPAPATSPVTSPVVPPSNPTS